MPYQGSTPGEVEPHSDASGRRGLVHLTGIEHMQSVTRADGVNIELQFKWGQDTSVKAVEARGKIDAIRADLPADLTAIRFSRLDGGSADHESAHLGRP